MISQADLERLEELEEVQAARETLAAYERAETISLEQLIEELTEAPSDLWG